MSSPLNLNQYLVDKVIFLANPLSKPEKAGKDEFNIEVHVSRKKVSRDFSMSLTISINRSKTEQKKHPYSLEFGIWGNFSFSKEVSEEDMLKMIHPLGVSILYGTARGHVGQLTGSAPYGCFILPNINVYEMLAKKSKTKKVKIPSKSKQIQ